MCEVFLPLTHQRICNATAALNILQNRLKFRQSNAAATVTIDLDEQLREEVFYRNEEAGVAVRGRHTHVLLQDLR